MNLGIGALIGFVVTTIITLLIQILPMSPFAQLALNEDFTTWLGWLNWIIDVGGMLSLFNAVLGCLVVAMVARWVITHLDDLIKGFTE